MMEELIWTMVRIFYRPVAPFIGHPERAYLMATGFAILLSVSVLRSSKLKPLTQIPILLATFLWVAFGLYEQIIYDTTGAIRLDLALIWPPLLVISGASVLLGFRDIVARKSTDLTADKTLKDPSIRAAPRRWRSHFRALFL